MRKILAKLFSVSRRQNDIPPVDENKLPVIECLVTFLPESEGGRRSAPAFTTIYRPHVVVGNPTQRKAIIKNRMLQEEYLGVVFLSGQSPFEFNKPLFVQLGLMYYPNVDYSQLVLGATFTIREGGNIVGYGEVVRCGLAWNKEKNYVSPYHA